MQSTYELVIDDNAGMTTIVPLGQTEVSIGRKTGNFIKLTERNVSRHHARLVRAGEALGIEDLGSYTGVRVNGERIAGRTPIEEGDKVQIGEYCLALRRVAVVQARHDRLLAEATHVIPVAPVAREAPVVASRPAVVQNGQRERATQVTPALPQAPRTQSNRWLGITMGVGVVALLGGLVSYHQLTELEVQNKVAPTLPVVRAALPKQESVRTVVPPPVPERAAITDEAPPSTTSKRKRHNETIHNRTTGDHLPPNQAAVNNAALNAESESKLLAAAQDYYISGKFADSLRVARKLQTSPGVASTKAWRILGAAACKLGKLELINEAYRHVDVVSRQYMLYVCQNAGVTQNSGRFVLAH